jgi:transposase-like protein
MTTSRRRLSGSCSTRARASAASRDLDPTETALREWVNRARADRTLGKTGLTTAEREELARLRKENRILREEREILTKSSLLRERAAVKFRFIAAERAHHELTLLCRRLRVTHSGFHASRNDPSRPTRSAIID